MNCIRFLALAQQYFGLIEIPAETFLTKSYPVEFRPADHIGIMFNAGDLGYQTTVIKQDGDNKVSNRDFSLGLNVGATIAFNYYF